MKQIDECGEKSEGGARSPVLRQYGLLFLRRVFSLRLSAPLAEPMRRGDSKQKSASEQVANEVRDTYFPQSCRPRLAYLILLHFLTALKRQRIVLLPLCGAVEGTTTTLVD